MRSDIERVMSVNNVAYKIKNNDDNKGYSWVDRRSEEFDSTKKF